MQPASRLPGAPSSRRFHQAHDHPAPTYPQGDDARYARGWMVRNNKAENWWHNGSLPGTTTIMVRTATSICWAALCNTRTEPSGQINTALDQMIWNMIRTVPSWE